MALRGLASRGLIRRPSFDLPEIIRVEEARKERSEGNTKSINIIIPFRLNIDSTFYDVDGRCYVQLAL